MSIKTVPVLLAALLISTAFCGSTPDATIPLCIKGIKRVLTDLGKLVEHHFDLRDDVLVDLEIFGVSRLCGQAIIGKALPAKCEAAFGKALGEAKTIGAAFRNHPSRDAAQKLAAQLRADLEGVVAACA